MAKLREVTRAFAHGEAPLEVLRQTARREILDRRLADGILALITEWENSSWKDAAWARNALRARVEDLVPTVPPPATSGNTGASATAAMYDAGLRGHLRRE
jgi:hypothetical protein